jgi:toxin ParE1/3/4
MASSSGSRQSRYLGRGEGKDPFGSALMEVVLLLSAERDLQEAYDWVEEHRRGREQFFLQDVELRLEHLQKFPLIGRLYRGRYRRLLIPRYPFGIFYVVESNRIVVHAVPDLRQDPEMIRERSSE